MPPTCRTVPLVLVGSYRRKERLVDALSANIVSVMSLILATRVTHGDPPTATSICPGFPNAPMRAVPMGAPRTSPPPVSGLTIAVERWERDGAVDTSQLAALVTRSA